VPRCLRALKLFNPDGLFIGDASYLFVPDQEHATRSLAVRRESYLKTGRGRAEIQGILRAGDRLGR